MKRLFTVLFICFFIFPLYSQEEEKPKHEIKYSGFVRNDLFYDTRQSVEALEGGFPLYPAARELDANGDDINAHATTNLLGVSTRMRVSYKGLEVLGAKFSALVEGDFTATSNTNSIRLRHTFANFAWERTSLMVGHFWHPMFVPNCIPSVISLSPGVPFQSFNRSPQIKLTHKINNLLTGIFALVYQGDSKSLGPSIDTLKGPERSCSYIRNAILPNLHAQVQLETERILIGGAFDYKVLQPRVKTFSSSKEKYKTNEKIGTYTIMGFVKYKAGKFTWKNKLMLGQNLYEHTLPGGYAVKSIDPATGKEEYTPYNHLYAFTDFSYKTGKFAYGLFMGYMKNRGTNDNIVGSIFARNVDLDKVYRVAPHFSYSENQVTLSFELEHTSASYGNIDFNDKGKVKNTYEVSNNRFLCAIVYDF